MIELVRFFKVRTDYFVDGCFVNGSLEFQINSPKLSENCLEGVIIRLYTNLYCLIWYAVKFIFMYF